MLCLIGAYKLPMPHAASLALQTTVVHSAVDKYNRAFSLSCAFYRPIEMLLDTPWGFWNCFCSGPVIGDFAQDCRFITIADNPRVYISIETFLFFVYFYV